MIEESGKKHIWVRLPRDTIRIVDSICRLEQKDPSQLLEELIKEGKIRLSHPQGTHDDRFWALALATYAARTQPSPKLWVISKAFKAKNNLLNLRQRLLAHKTGGATR